MIILLKNIKLPPGYEPEVMIKRACKMLRLKESDILSCEMARRSLDARDKKQIFYNCVLRLEIAEKHRGLLRHPNVSLEEMKTPEVPVPMKSLDNPPVIVGMGPCGLLAAWAMVKQGISPIVIDRGKDVENRHLDVAQMMDFGILNPESNIQFGEGGAGTYSDGKLTTSIKSDLVRRVLELFVEFGAPREILYENKPHVGTDRLALVVMAIRDYLVGKGAKFLYSTKLTGIKVENGQLAGVEVLREGNSEFIPTNAALLAIGHSARDTIEMLIKSDILMKPKSFAVGVRIEHRREYMDRLMYGDFAKSLPAASYRLSSAMEDGRGMYTFCVCPGGVVVPGASEPGRLVTNGMSYFSRNEVNTNGALVVTVTPDGNDPLWGIDFQRKLEEEAYNLGGGGFIAPAQLVSDFLLKKPSTGFLSVRPSYKPGVKPANLWEMDSLPSESLRLGLLAFERKCPGFLEGDPVLTAAETRTSSPVTISRDSLGETPIKGLYAGGEGAGFAGGIVSAAVDGIKIGDNIGKMCY